LTYVSAGKGVKFFEDLSRRRGDVSATVLVSGSCGLALAKDSKKAPFVNIFPGCAFFLSGMAGVPAVGWGTVPTNPDEECRFVTFKAFLASSLAQPAPPLHKEVNAQGMVESANGSAKRPLKKAKASVADDGSASTKSGAGKRSGGTFEDSSISKRPCTRSSSATVTEPTPAPAGTSGKLFSRKEGIYFTTM
jgi:hypothetical protein